jgi:DNA-nicking Smr family endonuclease
MGRRHKNRHGDTGEQAGAASSKPAPEATTSLGALFKAAGVAKVASAPRAQPPAQPAVRPPAVAPARPAPAVSPAAEMRMINEAYAGVRPLPRAGRHSAPPARPPALQRANDEERAQEAAARARLAALVSGGVRFKIVREDDYVSGYRSDASPKLVTRLSGKGFAPDATLDLHGQRAAQVKDLVASFARAHHRKGARQLLMIAGKGLHSADGVCVLRDALIDALTQGAAAPIVLAFATAHLAHGGTGAVAVLLT